MGYEWDSMPEHAVEFVQGNASPAAATPGAYNWNSMAEAPAAPIAVQSAPVVDTSGMLREAATQGAIGTVAGIPDLFASTWEGLKKLQDLPAAPPHDPSMGKLDPGMPGYPTLNYQVVAPVGDWLREKAKSAGLIGAPENQPQTPKQRVAYEAAQGAGAAAPIALPFIAAAGSVPAAIGTGAAMLASGAGGGALGEVGAQTFPKYETQARLAGNILGGIGAGGLVNATSKGINAAAGNLQYGPRMQRYIDAGISPASLGDVTESGAWRGALQQIQRATGDKLGGAGPAEAAGARWAGGVKGSVDDIVASLGGDVGASSTETGAGLWSAVNQWKKAQTDKYKAATRGQVSATPGPQDASKSAEAMRTEISSGSVGAVRGSLPEDLKPVFDQWLTPPGGKMVPAKIDPHTGVQISPAMSIPNGGGQIPLEELLRIRTKVKSMQRSAENNIGGYSQGTSESVELGRVHDAITRDVQAAIFKRGGPAALDEFNAGNRIYANMMNRLDTTMRKVIGAPTPEAAYKGATSGIFDPKGGATNLLDMKQAILHDLGSRDGSRAWGTFVGRIVNDLGMATPGSAEVWSPKTFMTQYNKMNSEAKDVLFGGPGKATLRQDLDRLAAKGDSIIGDAKVGDRFFNASQTSGGNQIADVLKTVSHEAMLGIGVGGATGGDVAAVAGTLLGVPLANYTFQKLMTSPAFIKWAVAQNPSEAGLGLRALASAANTPDEHKAIDAFIASAGGLGGPMDKKPRKSGPK